MHDKILKRYLEKDLNKTINSGFSMLLLGPRQTGKTTLIENILLDKKAVVRYFLQQPSLKLEIEADPSRLIREVESFDDKMTVFVDEAQKVPAVFDAAQYLIDKKKAQFILTGSSARKLRRKEANLLPGRVKKFYLDPLLWGELGFLKEGTVKELKCDNINKIINYSFEQSLIFGTLPGIVNLDKEDRPDFLRAYAEIYLEEEIRAEALSRKIGAFSRFLQLAANESGTSPNFSKLSNEAGVSQPAIKDFYNILEDTLLIERIEPYLKNARKRILSSPKYYFFDLGVRNALSRLGLSEDLIKAQKGILFEHAVMLEIIRRARVLKKDSRINYWRTSGGAEVDCVVDLGDTVIPIEIKCSANVRLSDVKGLQIFLNDYEDVATNGYVIKMGGRRERLADNIIAIPWNEL